MFTNVVPAAPRWSGRGWICAAQRGVRGVRQAEVNEDSDIDDDMLAHITARRRRLAPPRGLVASGDGRAFREPLEGLVARDVAVTVIGFREHATFALSSIC